MLGQITTCNRLFKGCEALTYQLSRENGENHRVESVDGAFVDFKHERASDVANVRHFTRARVDNGVRTVDRLAAGHT